MHFKQNYPKIRIQCTIFSNFDSKKMFFLAIFDIIWEKSLNNFLNKIINLKKNLSEHSNGGVVTETSKMEGMASKLKRRGWCGCLRDDEPPEITYCVVDGAGTLSLQAVTPALPMPEEEELNAKFAELVVSNCTL